MGTQIIGEFVSVAHRDDGKWYKTRVLHCGNQRR